MKTKFVQDKAVWVQTQWTNLWSRMSVHQLREPLDNSHTNSSLSAEVSEAVALYFQGDIEQSLLIGEEVEIREDSEGSDINTEAAVDQSDETEDNFCCNF